MSNIPFKVVRLPLVEFVCSVDRDRSGLRFLVVSGVRKSTPGRRNTPSKNTANSVSESGRDQKWHNSGTDGAKLDRFLALWQGLSTDQRAELLAQAEAFSCASESRIKHFG